MFFGKKKGVAPRSEREHAFTFVVFFKILSALALTLSQISKIEREYDPLN